jgi:phosphatidylserine decarboxylase
MRLPFTRYGLPQLVIYPVFLLLVIVILFFVLKPFILVPVNIVLFLVFVWSLSFFRDPARSIAYDENVLFSPADGTVTDIAIADDSPLGTGTLKIGIFLSVFNVHINRFPCAVRVEKISYKKGGHKNAMSAESGRINESNDITMIRLSAPKEKLLLRQISGAIARRIVCEAEETVEYRQGEAFGMIKFGSRTELHLPSGTHYEVTVKTGDKLRSGLTPLVRYKP